MILLSIIIPVYNVEKYIKKCLDSIFFSNASLDLFEVIIVNDGTPDKSMDVVAKYINNFNNITVYSQENMGLSEARNSGVKLAKGRYLWFVDSDDWLPQDAIRRICNLLYEYNPDILAIEYCYSIGEKSTIKNKAKVKQIYTGKDYLQINIAENPVQYYIINSIFFCKNNLHFYKGIYHEDTLFTPIALFLANSVIYDNSLSYIYNVRENSIMTSGCANLKHTSDTITVAEQLNLFLKNNALSFKDKKILSKYIAIAVGAVYYYWKRLNKKEKNLIAKAFPFNKMLIPIIRSLNLKYIVALFIIKIRCLKLS